MTQSLPSPTIYVWTFPLYLVVMLVAVFLADVNQTWFLFFNQWSQWLPGPFWAHLTIFGDTAVVIALMLPFALRRLDVMRSLVLAMLLGGALIHGLKPMLAVLRPPGVLSSGDLFVYGPRLIGDSFPSGHTLTAWVIAGMMYCYTRGVWRWIIVGVAVMVGVSRMVLGVHWPLDVLAGMSMGWFIGVLAAWLVGWLRIETANWLDRIAAVIFLATVIGLFWYDNGYPVTYHLQVFIAVISLASSVPVIKSRLIDGSRTHVK